MTNEKASRVAAVRIKGTVFSRTSRMPGFLRSEGTKYRWPGGQESATSVPMRIPSSRIVSLAASSKSNVAWT